MNWILTYNGVSKSFSDWGLSNLRRSRVSQAQDTVSFSCPGLYDAAELFPFGSIITISFQPDSGDPIPWFYGKVIQVPRSGSGTKESMDYVLAGPWWFLDNLVFQQAWLGANPAYDEDDPESEETVTLYKSRVILGQDAAGTRQTSGAVITEVINYAIASGAPIALGVVEPAVPVPFDEQNDITCAEAIRRMLRWSPDAISWFDYSTSPYPTFNCKRRPALSPIALATGDAVSNLSIIPRPDLQVPAVVLKFEQTNTINGVDYDSVTTQKFPLDSTGREFGALTATLQLAGTQATILSQKIETKDIPTELDESWWVEKDPTLAGENIDVFMVEGKSTRDHTDLPRELIEGIVQDWMDKEVEECTATAIALVLIYDDDRNIIKEEYKSLSCKFIATDATTRTYQRVTSLVSGEPVPVGLAESIYNSLNPLHYEGKITLTEEECGYFIIGADPPIGDFRAALGFTLNLTDGLSAWASMNALIQQIDEDVDSGITTISFGPPEQLSPQDLMEFLRANRGRGVAFSYQKRTTGQSAGGGNAVELSGPTPLLNTAGAGGQTKLLVVLADSAKKITLDPALITAVGATEPKPVAAEVMVGVGGN